MLCIVHTSPPCPSLPGRYITDADFDVGGPLHHMQMELLLWASYRGQLLSRTVRWALPAGRPAAPSAELRRPCRRAVSQHPQLRRVLPCLRLRALFASPLYISSM